MVQIQGDLPHTSLPRDLRAWLGELALGICRRLFGPPQERAHPTQTKPAARARDRQGQVAARWGLAAPP
ncbi:hypothetical protein MES5069_820002 [Mesorhizobium escarrei]|uniref:Uncharacterized protein n=1 Tax=Mesorhizobium escarrei TaxID=666018 RepID=A0ABN8KGG2_9HYPH|nr:hypothetical protein MES5069_820002 [Mesorhizobium escarrei]